MTSPQRDSAGPFIFIAYRRDDEPFLARSVRERLSHEFGSGHVFMDLSSLEPGDAWRSEIDVALNRATVLVAIIGNQWNPMRTGRIDRRLIEADDPLRYEIASALRAGIRVVPLLRSGVAMPGDVDLPEEVRGILQRQAIRIGNENFDEGMGRLVEAIRSASAQRDERHSTSAIPGGTVTPFSANRPPDVDLPAAGGPQGTLAPPPPAPMQRTWRSRLSGSGRRRRQFVIVATLSAVSAFLAVGAVAAILVLAQDDDDDSSEEVRRLFALDDRDLSLAASWSQPDCYRIVLTLWAAEQEGSKGGRLDAVAIATRIHTDEWVRENGLFASALDAMQILVEDPTPGAGCTAADEDWITNLDYIEF